ncbi:hypothetical protein [Pleomorphovibrio marinus]|uniref:hypothetical protein n=1 Tax=Pleomorphovibrio marinus TaxID=2164132 RepID=UPI000E0B79AC|nr:hypothetical protein [Pleomorphovibrio marinus]
MRTPEYSEVLVSRLEADQVLERVSSATEQEDGMSYSIPQTGSSFLFTGKIKGYSFFISEKVAKADSFLPLVAGKLEPTNKGSILFLDYRFFPSTIFFLGFWSVVTALLTIFFLVVHQNWLYSLLSFFIGAINYLFTWSNFKRKVRRSQGLLHRMLDVQFKD